MPNWQALVDVMIGKRPAQIVASAIPAGGHRLTLGLRPLDVAEWIDVDENFSSQLRERAALLGTRDDVLGACAGSQAAQREVLELLIEHLRVHFPNHYAFSAAGESARVSVQATGQSLSLDDEEDPDTIAIRMAAHLVSEDLCLLEADKDGKYRLNAAALCFPTRWKLADKLGHTLLDIHTPVPGYAREVGAATDRVMSSLNSRRALWRHNWSLLDSPALYQPERIELARPLGATEFGTRLWLRSERQTLRRLPRTGAVLFTIKIRQCTLETLCREAGAAEQLLGQIQTMPAALKAYKGLDQIDTLLCAYLRRASRVNIPGRPPSPNQP